MRKTSRPLPSFSIISCMRLAASATPMTTATVVFLVSAMMVDPIGATDPRKACGSITWRMVCPNVSPIDRAASA